MLSGILSAIYFSKWCKRFNIGFTLIYVIVPFANMAYFQIAISETVNEALFANNIVYIAGAFVPILITFCVLSLCKVHIRRNLKIALLAIQGFLYFSVITNYHHHLFYKDARIETIDNCTILIKEYGFLHTIFYISLVAYLVLNLIVLFIGLRKKNVTNTILILLFVDYCFSLFIHLAGRISNSSIELLPLAYVESQLIYLFVVKRTCLYDIEDTVIESLYKTTSVGYVSFDKKRRFLGCTEVMKKYMPELEELYLDSFLTDDFSLSKQFNHWMDGIDEEKKDFNIFIEHNNLPLKITAYYLYDKDEIRGYQFRVRDNSTEKQYIDLLNSYNEDLEKEVEEKTKHIREIQDKMVLGMADMVENRDNNTGGHIKRTSHVIRILVEEMKKHAAKGAEIVEQLLHGVEDPFFEKIAMNVAHYHHERVDGSGYPDKLMGDNIPFEARIMAIADVYDALVSKRCYKEAMSYDEAFQLIEEGMGTQFDAELNPYFVACRSKLEEYYKAQG